MSNDAIVLLKEDHKEIRKLFTDFENAGENATKTKGKIVQRIIEALTVHTYIENEVMYPLGSARFCRPWRRTSSRPMRSTTSPTSWSWSSTR